MHPLLGMGCFFLLSAAVSLADDIPSYRELACRVVDEAGSPVGHTTVSLDGLDRDAPEFPQNHSPREGDAPGWRFVSDADGCFTVRFGKFVRYEHAEATGLNEPGYGRFHLVVVKEGWAGGVSREILNLDDEALARRRAHRDDPAYSTPWDEEWSLGEFAPVVLTDQPAREPLEIVLKRGLDLHGRVLDPAGRPVPAVKLGVSLDLHLNSHTGYGGEIFEQEATTDQDGRFHFRHVYPNVFTVALSGEVPCWIRTQVRDRWANRIEDEISPRTGGRRHPLDYEKSIRMRLIVVREPPYRYFGRVTDPRGQGVAGVRVLLGSSRHEPPLTYGDEHGSQETRTDEQGNYSLQVGSRFVNWIQVRIDEAHPYKNAAEISASGDVLLAPKRYDFQVSP